MSACFRVVSMLALAIVAALAEGCAVQSAAPGEPLVPEQLFNGVGRPLWVTVAPLPDTAIVAMKPVTGAMVARAPCGPGRTDLLTVVPGLADPSATGLVYVQLLSRGEPVGAPLVLQPMTSPKTAVLVDPASHHAFWIDDSTGKAEFEGRAGTIRYYSESPIVSTGYRAYVERRVVLDTSEGEMEFEMRPDAAPNTAVNFEQLAAGGFYRQVLFHRVVPRGRDGNPFVIQAGDPTGTGDGGPGYSIDLEPSTLAHDFGVISMARDTDPNTNGSQFFVCLSREGTARLDGKYCAFGVLTRGAEVVKAIGQTPLREGTDRPIDPPVIRSARTISAPARRPHP